MNTTHQDETTASRRAILERYLSNPTDTAWEDVKETLYREMQQHGFHGGFPITSVAREDLESQGFDTSGTHLRRDTVIPPWFQASKAAAASDGHAVHC